MMIEIIMLAVVSLLLAKRNPRRRRVTQRNFAISKDVMFHALLTLADATVLIEAGNTLSQDFRYISNDATYTLADAAVDEGPLDFGWADPELTVTEIKEALEANPTSMHDYPDVEHAKRPVWIVGSFGSSPATSDQKWNEGKVIRTRMGRIGVIPAGKALPSLFVFNRSGGALTTGSALRVTVKHYGKWV